MEKLLNTRCLKWPIGTMGPKWTMFGTFALVSITDRLRLRRDELSCSTGLARHTPHTKRLIQISMICWVSCSSEPIGSQPLLVFLWDVLGPGQKFGPKLGPDIPAFLRGVQKSRLRKVRYLRISEKRETKTLHFYGVGERPPAKNMHFYSVCGRRKTAFLHSNVVSERRKLRICSFTSILAQAKMRHTAIYV